MTKSERIALIYGISVVGAAVVSYKRGKRGFVEIGTDAAVHGGIVGTGVNVVFYLQEDAAVKSNPAPATALPNRGGQEKCSPYGKIAADGLSILSAIKPDVLYKTAKLAGISIAPEGDDPSRVVLPKD
jgi:hypothetical protein